MVVVECENEAKAIDGRVALGADDDLSARSLPGVHELALEGARQHAVEIRPRCVVRQPRGQRERVGAAGAKLDFGQEAMMTRETDTLSR